MRVALMYVSLAAVIVGVTMVLCDRIHPGFALLVAGCLGTIWVGRKPW